MTTGQLFDAWYRYAAKADGFIGAARPRQREQAKMSEEEQRALLGIGDETYNALWLRLQAMPLPRLAQFTTDLMQITKKV